MWAISYSFLDIWQSKPNICFSLRVPFVNLILLFSLSSFSIIIMMLMDKGVVRDKIIFLALSKKANLDY